jgi:hypothetical protein
MLTMITKTHIIMNYRHIAVNKRLTRLTNMLFNKIKNVNHVLTSVCV